MSGANSGCCSNAEKAQGQDKVKQSVVLKTWAVSRASVSEITLSCFFSNPFKAGAVPFLLCKKSPYLEIPNEEHQPFSIAPHCSQNTVQGPGAINLERECRISGPIPHLRNPILQLNKIPGKLYTHSRARSTGLINLPPRVPQDSLRQTRARFVEATRARSASRDQYHCAASVPRWGIRGEWTPRGFPRLCTESEYPHWGQNPFSMSGSSLDESYNPTTTDWLA